MSRDRPRASLSLLLCLVLIAAKLEESREILVSGQGNKNLSGSKSSISSGTQPNDLRGGGGVVGTSSSTKNKRLAKKSGIKTSSLTHSTNSSAQDRGLEELKGLDRKQFAQHLSNYGRLTIQLSQAVGSDFVAFKGHMKPKSDAKDLLADGLEEMKKVNQKASAILIEIFPEKHRNFIRSDDVVGISEIALNLTQGTMGWIFQMDSSLESLRYTNFWHQDDDEEVDDERYEFATLRLPRNAQFFSAKGPGIHIIELSDESKLDANGSIYLLLQSSRFDTHYPIQLDSSGRSKPLTNDAVEEEGESGVDVRRRFRVLEGMPSTDRPNTWLIHLDQAMPDRSEQESKYFYFYNTDGIAFSLDESVKYIDNRDGLARIVVDESRYPLDAKKHNYSSIDLYYMDVDFESDRSVRGRVR